MAMARVERGGGGRGVVEKAVVAWAVVERAEVGRVAVATAAAEKVEA